MEYLFDLLFRLIYIFSSIYFIIISKKCFIEKMTIPKTIGLFFLSPYFAYALPQLLYAGYVYATNQDVDMMDVKVVIVNESVYALAQLAILFVFMVMYIKVVKAKNPSIAMFVYLCSVMIIPGPGYLLMTKTVIPYVIYTILHLMLYKLVIVPLSGITKEKQVTDAKLFVILPFLTFLYNIVMDALYWCISYAVEINDNQRNVLVDTMKNDNELGAVLKPLVYMFSRGIKFLGDILIYSCIFSVVILIIAFYVIVKNIIYMNELVEKQKEIKMLSVEVMEALAHTIDAKDEYTRGHSVRVAKYSRMIAEKMGLSDEECENVYYMGLLHDIGKIGVPNEIINKPDKLTDEEYGVIKTHPMTGFDILAEIKSRPDLATGARWHHERFDGHGYPDSRSGEEIPIEARIIAVADSYDAMTSNRSYRGYMPQEKVRCELEKNIGTQFDEVPAKCMIAIIDEDKDYVLHE